MSKNNNNNNTIKISEYDKLVVDIRNNLTTRLTDLMSKLLNSAQDDLFDMSEAADNNEEQARYFELMNQLRTQKPVIAVNFSKEIKEYLIPAGDFEAKKIEQKSEDEGELSLVDQDEMEGMVLVKGISERAASKYREQLSHLEARLEHLAYKTSTVFTKNALVPNNICQAFNDALGDEFDNTNKKILFRMFDVEIANKLDALYDSINNRLIDAGILPQIKLHTQKQATRSRPKAPPVMDENMTQDQQEQFDDGSGYSGMGGQAGGYQGSAGQGPAAGATGGMAGGNTGPGGGAAGGNNISGFAMTATPGGTYRHSSAGGYQAGAGAPGGQGASGTGGAGGDGGNVPGGTMNSGVPGSAGGPGGVAGGPGGSAGGPGGGAGGGGAGGGAGGASGPGGVAGGPGAGGASGPGGTAGGPVLVLVDLEARLVALVVLALPHPAAMPPVTVVNRIRQLKAQNINIIPLACQPAR